MVLLGALAMAILVVIGVSRNRSSPSLSRVADRVERADVLPEETRVELKRLIEMVNRDGSDRSAARIERALQIKPIERPASR
jgi:hypothetical protein